MDEIKKYMKELKAEFSKEAQRHLGVLAEDFQSKLDVVVEGHQVLNKKIDDLREEDRKDHQETRAMLKLSYLEIDKKVRTFETEYSKLKTRVERLEATRT